MAMRDKIFEAIKKGGATRESLLAVTGTTEKGLASQFTYLRMMGKCPMKQEDGTYKIVSTEEWEAHRASAGSSSIPLTPEQRFEKAEKRSKRAASAYDSAKKRAETNVSELNQLKLVKAEAELKIAEIELGQAETETTENTNEADSISETKVETEVETEVDELNELNESDEPAELDFNTDEFNFDIDEDELEDGLKAID